MRVALVHEYLIRFGGAERVLQTLHTIFPHAPIFTLIFDRGMRPFFPHADIRPSFLSSFAKVISHRLLLPLLPLAIESIDLGDYDLVISSSSGFAKGVVTRAKTVHVCYCHSPTRYLWDWHAEYLHEPRVPRVLRPAARFFVHLIRLWDQHAGDRPDYYIANSQFTAHRIKKYYRREAVVIYPPLRLAPSKENKKPRVPNKSRGYLGRLPLAIQNRPYFVIVSHLTPHKRIDIAVRACAKLAMPLVVVGSGPERRRLERLGRGAPVGFLGWQPDFVVGDIIARSAGALFPGEDDFGMAPLETMVLGKPVLAYRGGGALEWMVEGATGEFFDEPSEDSFSDGLLRLKKGLENRKYNPVELQSHAAQFNEKRFCKELLGFLGSLNIKHHG